MIHVAIVDDDEWVRRGRVAALGETDDIVPVIGVDHRSAMAMSLDEWAGIDKVLIDAYFDEADFDHFAGVGVAERIRSVELSPQPTLIVVTGHVLNDVLRLRLAQAGADYLFSHYQVRTVEQLAAAVRDPGAFAIDLVPHPDGLGRLGLSADSRPNDALRWVEREGLHQLFREAESGESQKTYSIGRRRISAIRHRLADVGGVARTAKGQRTRIPEWAQVVDLVANLRGSGRKLN